MQIARSGKEQRVVNQLHHTLQRKLDNERSVLVRTMGRLEQQLRAPQHEFGKDDADRAHSAHDKELSSRQMAGMQVRLNLILRAIAKINDGNYGECSDCGEEISPKRLEALPWTSYCIACQAVIERRS